MQDNIFSISRCNITSCLGGKCWETPAGALCTCPHGFKLSTSNNTSTCVDIDECEEGEFGICSQLCENIPGSFLCSCLPGYVYSRTASTCVAQGFYPLLLFSTRKEIRGMSLEKEITEYFIIYADGEDITSVGYDGIEKQLYWLDGTTVQSCFLHSCQESLKTIIGKGLVNPKSLAIDWLGRRLYVLDAGLKNINVCDLEGNVCSSIVKNLDDPQAITINPQTGTMYWTEWGKNPKIEAAEMDGSNQITLVNSSVGHPNGLVVDFARSRLYWTETQLQKIETIQLNGADRREISLTSFDHPFSIAVFQDTVYWSDWMLRTLESANKFNGRNRHTLIKENHILPTNLHIYHPVLQQSDNNPCASTVCSHLCVLALGGHYSCSCPEGYKLKFDGKTCIHQSHLPYILVSSFSDITKLYQGSMGNSEQINMQVKDLQEVMAMTVDEHKHILYYSDTKRNVIKAVNLDSLQDTDIVTIGLGLVTDIALDWISNNLYVVDSTRLSIDVVTLGNHSYRISIHEMTAPEQPTSIALHPSTGAMFYTIYSSSNSNSRIEMSFMDGSKKRNFIESETTGVPVTLAIDYTADKLLWYDAQYHRIESISLDGTRRMIVMQANSAISISVFSNVIYWVNKKDGQVNLARMHQGRVDNGSIQLLLSAVGNYSDVVVVNYKNKTLSNECSVKQGGCSHICLPTPAGHTCKCPAGFSHTSNNTTCTPEKVCGPNEWTCGDGTCIAEKDKCNNIINCPDKSDEEAKMCKPCEDGSKQCENGQCLDSLYWCDAMPDCKDGSDESNCTFCRDSFFHCPENICLTQSRVCNDEADCSDGSDEMDCKAKTPVYCNPAMQFACLSGQQKCIPQEWYCDGEADCADSSDEPPTCSMMAASCSDTEFWCQTKECILWHAVCDGQNNCTDGSDEGTWCEHACGLNNGGCSDICQPTPTGPMCRCYQGHRMGGDNRTCHDIDECAENSHHCDQLCENIKASYKCYCEHGFLLQQDGFSCRPEDQDAKLVYALQTEIHSITLPGEKDEEILYKTGRDERSSIFSLTFNAVLNTIYWTDVYKDTINYLVGNKVKVISHSIEIPTSIAYDWIAGNLYYADQGIPSIAVCGTFNDGNTSLICINLINDAIDHPSSIALHPKEGLMFWADTNDYQATIERCSMDGSNRTVIINTNIEQPLALAVDFFHRKIYWIDASLDYIASSDFDGQQRKTILNSHQGPLFHPCSLAIFGSWLYISEHKLLAKVNKYTGGNWTDIHRFSPYSHDTPQGLIVMHPSLQKSAKNPCTSSPGNFCMLNQLGCTCRKATDTAVQGTAQLGTPEDDHCKLACQHGGTCSVSNSSSKKRFCLCAVGYRGTLCEEKFGSLNGQTLWIVGTLCSGTVITASLFALWYYLRRVGKLPLKKIIWFNLSKPKNESRPEWASYDNPCYEPDPDEDVNNNSPK